MEDSETSALFMALSALVTSMHTEKVMDSTKYLLRCGAMAEGARRHGQTRIQKALQEHALAVAHQVSDLGRGSSSIPPH